MMKTSLNRRGALRAFAKVASLPAATTLASASALAATPNSNLPTGRFRLNRLLERGLSDGKMIRVAREWACEFSRPSGRFGGDAGGMLFVTGQQIAVSVEAPAKLAPLAEIERTRIVTELFPGQLDSKGRLTKPFLGTSDADMERAMNAAMDIYRREGSSAQTIQNARLFLTNLTNSGAAMLSQIPADLFYPTPGLRKATQEIALPSGLTGAFELEVKADVRAQTGLLQNFARTVTTRTADDARVSREVWELNPA
jgi:hypothetical protein